MRRAGLADDFTSIAFYVQLAGDQHQHIHTRVAGIPDHLFRLKRLTLAEPENVQCLFLGPLAKDFQLFTTRTRPYFSRDVIGPSLGRDHGQPYVRRIGPAVVNGLLRPTHVGTLSVLSSRIRIAIETRKVRR